MISLLILISVFGGLIYLVTGAAVGALFYRLVRGVCPYRNPGYYDDIFGDEVECGPHQYGSPFLLKNCVHQPWVVFGLIWPVALPVFMVLFYGMGYWDTYQKNIAADKAKQRKKLNKLRNEYIKYIDEAQASGTLYTVDFDEFCTLGEKERECLE